MEDLAFHWELFKYSWISAWLIAVVLAMVGILVVSRNQIFVGAAISQASTLGIAVALAAGGLVASGTAEAAGHAGWLESDAFATNTAVLFSIAAALVAGRYGRKGRESAEAVTGWIFLASSSASILLVSFSPHSLEEVHKLLFSSIIAATAADVWIIASVTIATVIVVALQHRPLLLLITDREMAASVGLRVRLWETLAYGWLGLVVGFSLKTSGLLYTFGGLVLPALIAKNLCREVRPMLAVAPAVALACALAGIFLAHFADVPPAQMTVALGCGVLAVCWGLGAIRRRG